MSSTWGEDAIEVLVGLCSPSFFSVLPCWLVFSLLVVNLVPNGNVEAITPSFPLFEQDPLV